MTQSEYEQKKRECWEEVSKEILTIGGGKEKRAFDFAFDRAYALGKQENDVEGEEMLTVSRKKVQELHNRYFGNPLEPVSKIRLRKDFQDLFDSKCLPDNVDSSDANVDSSYVSVESLEPKPAEPKFKLGDKVKDTSSPHDDGIYKVDDIKKSSDGFIYHIQGLNGKSNVKESDLEPYTEPHGNVNLSQETANCGKHFDRIPKDCFSKERRLNMAAQFMSAMMSNPAIFHQHLNAEEEDYILYGSLEFADALISETEKGGER